MIASNRLLWLGEAKRETEREGWDKKLISRRVKLLVSVAQGLRSETWCHKSGLLELLLLAMLSECSKTTHLSDRK